EESHLRLREALEAAVAFFRHHLRETPAGEPVLAYLRQRGLTDAALESFEIGYAPHAWDVGLHHLQERGYSEQELLDCGLVSERESGGVYDRFRNRIMIPIRDARGRMAGFGARIVDPNDVPKFLNSPQTPVFDKGRLLFGLDKARKPIRAADQAVIVEGYFDVIALHQAGQANAVSPMGTALSEDQLRLLKRFTRRIVLALDADAAGDQATLRGLTLAREAMDRQADPVFDARGLVRHEGRLDAELRVVTLPPGKDPDEVVAEDPEGWPALVGRAQSVVDYVLDVLTSGRYVTDPKMKSQVARQVLPLIEDVADPVEREVYRQKLARRLQVDERALQPGGGRPAAGRKRRAAVEPPTEPAAQAPEPTEARIERFCLGLLLQTPDIAYRVDRALAELELERLAPEDFTGTERQVIFQAVRSALAQDDQDPGEGWQRQLPEALVGYASSLVEEIESLSMVGPIDLNQPKVLEEVLARFLQLRKRVVDSDLQQIQFQLLAAQDESEASEEKAMLTGRVRRLAGQKSKLEQALVRKQGWAAAKRAG
ncbi:MAG: toprim domain-containing protein, partial [Chloroflexi bacterium]|nr:toprim domain-containing protein [Chloroflexota bacterium]